MTEALSDSVVLAITQASELYHRLVLLVAPPGAGKSPALQDVERRTGAPLLNLNLALSYQMLDLTGRQRALQLPRLISELVEKYDSDTILLDNIEMLFDISLKQDPLRLLQGLSRRKTIVAAWSGTVEEDHVVYAIPGHPEYRRYPRRDVLVVR